MTQKEKFTTEISNFSGKYSFLSNFFTSFIATGDGNNYTSVEHAFQAYKVLDPVKRREVLGLTAGQAKRWGRKVLLRKDWESVKDFTMYFLVFEKFAQNEHLLTSLLATGDATLIEGNHWHDTYWGVCNGVGQNKLGKILMRVRDELK